MKKKTSLLILDIDSSSVGACVVDFTEKPQLSAVTRTPITTGEVRDPHALAASMLTTVRTVVSEYARTHPGLTRVAVVCASPWFAANVKSLTTKSEKPVKVTTSSIRTLVQDFKSKNPPATGQVVLEALPVMVEVNGYRTRLASAVHGTSLAVTFYESATDHTIVHSLEEAIHTSLARAVISWHTTPLVYAETLLRLSDEDHAIVIDVGGEVTDVMVLSHQRIAYVGSVPVGFHTIARTIAGAKGAHADALSRLTLFAQAELTEKEMQTMATALDTASAAWRTQYLAVLADAGNFVPLSHRVFVIGERDELPWCTHVIAGAEVRGQRSHATVVDSNLLGRQVAYGPGGVFDSSLALDALFFHMRDTTTPESGYTPPVLYSVQ